MAIVLNDMVWPAIYVTAALSKFWVVIIGTIVLETFVIKYFLEFTWSRSVWASLVGNMVSGLVGTYFMMWAMLLWHLVADNFVPHATFGFINWVATYVLMCLGSVYLEVLTVRFMYGETVQRLFWPLLVGNAMSYIFIVIVMLNRNQLDY
ncbi:MAG: hypothetical protein U0289_06185 [Cyclobacteriaceae bacterium]|jgi:hypothetical protein|nr:hypothetical protein [Cytophagales bacterium]HNP77535.1 hypothetical protein [Cyclobacteriaceae bacterium]